MSLRVLIEAKLIPISHVAKTDAIKDFVITEECSIAKGIRRIVAVTGHEANDVSRKAVDFERRLERIEGMQGKEKEAAMKPYLVVSAVSFCECWLKITRNSVKAVSLLSENTN